MKQPLVSADQTATLQQAGLEAWLVTASDYTTAFLQGNDSLLMTLLCIQMVVIS